FADTTFMPRSAAFIFSNGEKFRLKLLLFHLTAFYRRWTGEDWPPGIKNIWAVGSPGKVERSRNHVQPLEKFGGADRDRTDDLLNAIVPNLSRAFLFPEEISSVFDL